MDQHQDVRLHFPDLLEIVDLLHLRVVLKLLDDRPGLRRQAAHLHLEVAEHRPHAVHGHDRLALAAQVVEQARDVVFEELLALELEEGNDDLLLARFRREAEIDLGAGLVDRHALHAERDGLVLDLGERLRVLDRKRNLAATRGLDHAQHVLHAKRVVAVDRGRRAERVGVVERQLGRLLQLGDDVARAFRQRIELVLGQVGAQADDAACREIERDEQRHGEDRDGDPAALPVHDPAEHRATSLRRLSGGRSRPRSGTGTGRSAWRSRRGRGSRRRPSRCPRNDSSR